MMYDEFWTQIEVDYLWYVVCELEVTLVRKVGDLVVDNF